MRFASLCHGWTQKSAISHAWPREAVGAPETRSALPLMALMDPNFNGPALNVPRQAWKFPQHRKGLGDRLMFPSKGSIWNEMGKPTV